MAQGSVKKPKVQAAKPTTNQKKPPAQKPPAQKPPVQKPTTQKPPVKKPSAQKPHAVPTTPPTGQKPHAVPTTPPTGQKPPPSQHQPTQKVPPKPRSHKPVSRGALTKIWERDNDIDFEDITFVVPIVIFVILLLLFFVRMYIRRTVKCPSKNRLEGKTVVITGANTGIGKSTATELARRGAKVIIGCRDKAKGEAVSRKIRVKSKNHEVHAYELDLASLASIKNFVNEFNEREASLHVLINNAAYMGPKEKTEDGFERSFGVNYLGHFYLTQLLYDKLRRGAPSRIVNLISDSYKLETLNFQDLSMEKYHIYRAYARSKLAMVAFNTECHRRYFSDMIMSFGVHPGWVNSDLMRNLPSLKGQILRTAGRILFKSPDDGAQTVVFAAVADKLRDQSGKVFENCQLYKIKDFAKDKNLGSELWNVSLNLCGIPTDDHMEHPHPLDHLTRNGNPDVQDVGHSEDKKTK